LWSPTPQQAEFLQAVEPTCRFLDDLPAAVRQQYAGQWIAAKDSKIIAAAPTLAELCETLGDSDNPAILKLWLERGVTITKGKCPMPAIVTRILRLLWP
jgi:hypothetical protein